MAGSYGIALSTVASVAALRSVRGLSLSAAQVTALNLVEGYFDSLERPEVRHAGDHGASQILSDVIELCPYDSIRAVGCTYCSDMLRR